MKPKFIILLLICYFSILITSEKIFASVSVNFVAINNVELKISLKQNSEDYHYKYELYRGNNLLKTYTGDGKSHIYYDSGLQNNTTYEYNLKYYYQIKENGEWGDWSSPGNDGKATVNTGIIYGTIDKNITISGEGKISDVVISEGYSVTIKNASITTAKDIDEDSFPFGKIEILKNSHLKVYNSTIKWVYFKGVDSQNANHENYGDIIIENSNLDTCFLYGNILRFNNNNMTNCYKSYFFRTEQFNNNTGGIKSLITDFSTLIVEKNKIYSTVSLNPCQKTGSIFVKENIINSFLFSSLACEEGKDNFTGTLSVDNNTFTELFLISPNTSVTNNNFIKEENKYLIEINGDNVLISNNNFTDKEIILENMINSEFSNNSINYSNNSNYSGYGIYINKTKNFKFQNNVIKNSNSDKKLKFLIKNNNNSVFENNKIYDFSKLTFEKSFNNKLITNIFDSSKITSGLFLKTIDSYNNKIYNNKFVNISDIFGYCNTDNCSNNWFNNPQLGTNIIDGNKIGGNYWSFGGSKISFNCVDSNKDGLCDNAFTYISKKENYSINESCYEPCLSECQNNCSDEMCNNNCEISCEDECTDVSYQSYTTVYDKYPLYLPEYQVASTGFNPSNSPWTLKNKPMKVMHVRFKNNKNSTGDAVIETIKFLFTGEGDINDIEDVTLFKDKTCSFNGNLEKIATKNFTDNQVIFTDINDTVLKGGNVCFLLEYKFKNQIVSSSVKKSDYSPCAIYGAKLKGEDFKIKVNNSYKYVYGEVTGTVNASYPEINYADEISNYFALKNKKLNSALSVKIDDFVKNSCIDKWEAIFEISKEPLNNSGAFLEDNGKKGKKIKVPFSNNIASVYFTGGSFSGNYEVTVSVGPVSENNLSCPTGVSLTPLKFNIFVGGIKLTSTLDGSSGGTNDNIVSTFISTIDAKNKFTAEINLPANLKDKIKEVKFTPNWGAEEIIDNEQPFEAEYNMAGVKENSILTVTAVLTDNTAITETYNVYAIQLPDWINTFNGFPYKGIEWGFDKNEKNYKLTFSFPDDFAWSNPIPDNIPAIGGEEDEESFNCSVEAKYSIDTTSSLHGKAEFKGELLGKNVEAKGNMDIYFDKEFKVKEKPAPTGKAEANVEFDLGSKTLASKTILVYGIPITVQVDVGGNVNVFAAGRLIFHKTLKLKKVVFVPGLTITLTIDASASAALGVAKIGIKSEPTGTVKIKISYATENGNVNEDAFGGEFSVPVTIYGSLFWGKIEGELGTTEFGPWSFGDSVKDATLYASSCNITKLQYMKNRFKKIKKSSVEKKLYTTSDIDIDSNGNTVETYIKDTSTDNTINPEIAVKLNNSETIITNNEFWEIDPSVTFTENGKILLLWTSNNGDKSLTKFNEILNHQNIAYSYYNGSSWSDEKLIINDSFSDGISDVAYGGNNTSMAVWTHNSGTTEYDIQNRSKYEIYYSIFNETTQQWTSPVSIPSTSSGTGDFMAKITSLGNGKFGIVWIKDNDGKLFTKLDKITKGSDVNDNNSDCNVYFAEFNGTSWTTPETVSPENNRTELMPDIAYTSLEKPVIVWVEKSHSIDSLYIAKRENNNWSSPLLLDQGNYLIENPNISIDKNNIAHIIYRKISGKREGLFVVKKNLSEITTASYEINRLTLSKGSLFTKAKVSPDGDILMSWTNVHNSITFNQAKIDKTDNSTLKKTGYLIQLYDNSTGKFKGIQLSIPVSIDKQGKFRVRANLYKDNKLITSATSADKELNTGDYTFYVVFSGRAISGSKLNGVYYIKDIVLEKFSPAPVIIDRDTNILTTDAYLFSQFISPALITDKDIYLGNNAKILITVYDDNETSPVVFVSNATENTGKMVPLTGTSGMYTGEINVSELNVKEGNIITLFYIDSKGEQWNREVMWMEKPPEVYELFVKVDNYTGENKITGLSGGINCPSNCYESLEKGTSVTLTAIADNNSKFTGWSITYCDNSSDTCSFTMDNNTEITAYFKQKLEDFMNDTTGDIAETGVNVKRTMSLSNGWNLISIPVDKEFNTGDIFKKANTIWSWTGSSWSVWSPGSSIITLLNKYKIPVLSKIESAKGYWVNAGENLTEEFQGKSYGKDKINISLGWNLLGIGIKIDITEFTEAKTLWKWIGSSWSVWSSDSNILNLLNKYKIPIASEIKAGEGFWVYKQ